MRVIGSPHQYAERIKHIKEEVLKHTTAVKLTIMIATWKELLDIMDLIDNI